ncbi:MAG: hypothetical protein KA109_04545 [Saprospiraceae bacterium]|jgi:uncharacterized damage-inducible protein DinB|nr:DinB family protein [Saprospiraceae bacterium]MBK6817075.1 DinB family protein [Saprospiraceae bacterium]MBK7371602.1 DinB family protein [Saprospiraceae bacterium]MBK7435898.1 DinB family protein [Saprospiraceae bacterium]MBK8281677.1 DinB family protein [Saprospiraceae bacterium]
MITFIESFKRELESEAAQTRRMLAIVPADKMDWQPHTKSMKLKPLASHLAEMPLMIAIVLKHPRWDFINSPYPAADMNTADELLERLDFAVNEAIKALDESSDDILEEPWSLGAGDVTYLALPKWEAVRHAFGQNAHHRAQLQVCMRLLDIPVPGPYGPSADEMGG